MTRTHTQGDIVKLPRWARDEIHILQQTVATLTRELRQFQGAEDSTITMRAFSSMEFNPMPEGVVRFHLGTERWLDVRLDGDGVDLMAQPRWLHITPLAGNHVRARVE